MKYLVITGAEDDNLDTDVGYKGFIQFVIAIQRAGGAVGDAMIEADSNGNEQAVPRQFVRLSNFTFIQRSAAGADLASILIRGGADYSLSNGLMISQSGLACVRLNGTPVVQAASAASDEQGPPTFNSVLLSGCNSPFLGSGDVTTARVQQIFAAGSNNRSTYTPTLTSLFINGSAESRATAFDADGAERLVELLRVDELRRRGQRSVGYVVPELDLQFRDRRLRRNGRRLHDTADVVIFG